SFFAIEDDAAILALYLLSVTAPAFPNQRSVGVFNSNDLGVWGIPIVLKVVATTYGTHADGIICLEPPAGQIYFVGAVVERLACTPMPKPMPIVVDQSRFVGHPRCRALPQIVI